MPTDEENTQYLYLILTHGGNPTIDWDAVGTAMDLKKGAVSKRWSRLKKSMEAGETPAGSVYKFLWLCVKHSTRDKALDWTAIAEKCGTTSGAASKRYSRMKQAFETGAEPPASGGPASPGGAKTPAKATPKKAKAAATDGDGTPTPKRKRAPAKKKGDETKQEDDGDDAEQVKSPKKPRVTKKKAAAKSKGVEEEKAEDTSATEDASQVKSEVKEEGEGGSVDVGEWIGDLEDKGEEVEV